MEKYGAMQQISALCDELIPQRVYALVLGNVSNSLETQVPRAPAFISSNYNLPLLSAVGQADDTVSEHEIYNTVLRLQPHKSHEVEAWCALLGRLQLTHAVMVTSTDAVGTEYEKRVRHCWWRGNVIRYVQFLHYGMNSKRADFTQISESIKHTDYKVIMLYAETRLATVFFDEALSQNLTGAGWIWIVSEYAQTDNVPVGALITRHVKQSESVLIDEAVTLLAYSISAMLKTTWERSRLRTVLPPKACINALDSTWSPEGKHSLR